jgi:hypothetical protein
MLSIQAAPRPPFTMAVRQALQGINNSALEADLLFLEAWEMHPSSHLGVTLRANQNRRANPKLAAAIGEELRAGPIFSVRLGDRQGKLERQGPPAAAA